MVQVAEVVKVPYSDALTEAGVAHLLQVLQAQGDHPTYESFDAMRQHVAEKAAMLAFRHLMDADGIPYTLTPSTRYTDDLDPHMSLGGRRTTLFTTLVREKRAIALLGREPERINGVPALVPRQDDMYAQGDDDIYIFTAITGLVTRSRDDVERAADAGQPLHMIHALPTEWRLPHTWQDLGELVLKTDMSAPATVSLGGVDGTRERLSCEVRATPGIRERVPAHFHAIRYVSMTREPDGPLGIHSPALKATDVVNMYDWGNLWVYGMDVYFLGYLTCGEYQRRARFVPVGTNRFGIPSTTQPLWSVPVPVLRSLSDLFERVTNWAEV